MILPKSIPETGEIVLIRIKKIMPFGAYCELQEYRNIDAYLPIKEIASGWIKNIHEFIKEDQKGVAKVVFIDRVKKTIDVSLKKVSKKEEKDKINDYNLEKRSENLFSQAIANAMLEDKKQEILNEVAKKYATFNDIINTVLEGKDALSGVKFGEKLAPVLKEVVEKNVKPKIYAVAYTAEVVVYNTKNGVALIKKALKEVEKLGVKVIYLGAPRYRMFAEGPSYPKAEERIKQAYAILEKTITNGTLNIKKEKV
jgi:translation initiation factor 2 subunit 1